MPQTKLIRAGESLPFSFTLDDPREDITGWVCTIYVNKYPTSGWNLKREISPKDDKWSGDLTSAETKSLLGYYNLKAKLEKASTGEQQTQLLRFEVGVGIQEADPEFSPAFLSELWLDSANQPSIDSPVSEITTWNDTRLNGKSAEQLVGLNRPGFSGVLINDHDPIQFNSTSSDKFMDVNLDFLSNSSMTIMAVVRRITHFGAYPDYFLGQGNGGVDGKFELGWNSDTDLKMDFGTNAVNLTVPAFEDGVPALITARFSPEKGKRLKMLRGGLTFQESESFQRNHFVGLGSGFLGKAAGGFAYSGDIAELIIWKDDISNSWESRVQFDLINKWGL